MTAGKVQPIITAYKAGNATATFTGQWSYISIANDGASSLTATVNGMVVTVIAGQSYDGWFETFKTITITTTVAYRLVLGV